MGREVPLIKMLYAKRNAAGCFLFVVIMGFGNSGLGGRSEPCFVHLTGGMRGLNEAAC